LLGHCCVFSGIFTLSHFYAWSSMFLTFKSHLPCIMLLDVSINTKRNNNISNTVPGQEGVRRKRVTQIWSLKKWMSQLILQMSVGWENSFEYSRRFSALKLNAKIELLSRLNLTIHFFVKFGISNSQYRLQYSKEIGKFTNFSLFFSMVVKVYATYHFHASKRSLRQLIKCASRLSI